MGWTFMGYPIDIVGANLVFAQNRGDHKDRPYSNHHPNSAFSTRSQMMWMMVIWPSWTRGVSLEGTTSARSQTALMLPPSLPSSPTVRQPRPLASSSALSTLGELPLVEIPITTSPAEANASTWRLKTE